MKFFIKNKVCNRCKTAVRNEFEKTGIYPVHVELGEVENKEELSPKQIEHLQNGLVSLGFELIDNKKSRVIEKIKNVIIDSIQHLNADTTKINYSHLIESKLNKDYTYLTNLFSEVEGTTIEKFIICQKIERVKELLVYDELSLSEIAYTMGDSSLAHLSNQFKKVTGLIPSHFKNIGDKKRKPLDEV
ncbi:MAG: AraC family transcriptional regulator [Chitinophagales bacterium]|nr:AraC family transcriptional regulator [Chitinophagales bacterium]